MMQTPLRTEKKQHCDIGRIKLHSDQTFPVGAAVHVDEEDPQGDHQLHDGAQGSPVLGLSDLRGVSRSRQNESSASKTCEEPGREGGEST